MILGRVLQLSDAVVDGFDLPPNDKGPKAVMVLRVPVTPGMIETLGIEWAFEDGALREAIRSVPLRFQLLDHMISLPSPATGWNNYYPERIHKLRLEESGGDAGADLTFRVHFTAPQDDPAKLLDLVQFHLRFLKQPFECALQPRQGNLFEGGARVDMAPGDAETAPAAAAGAIKEAFVDEGPALSSVAEMKRRHGTAKKRQERVN